MLTKLDRRTLFIIVFCFLLIAPSAGQEKSLRITPSVSSSGIDSLSGIYFAPTQRPKICLVLSGGGSRGFAHLGVIKELERNNIPIDFIVGTSIGGIIGGLYASGYSTDDLQRLVDTTDWGYILSLTQDNEREDLYLAHKVSADRKQLTVRFDGLTPVLPSAISSGQRLTNFINQLTLQSLYHPVRNFDDLKIPFRCVSTDLISGTQMVFSSGNLSEALRASISIPLLYHPLKKDSLSLTDGGLISNIPVDVARKLGADIIIAVNTVSPLRTAEQLNYPWEVTDQIVNIMAQEKNRRSLEEATIVITPDLGFYPSVDFSQLNFVVQQGVYAAGQQMKALRDSIRFRQNRLWTDQSPLTSFSMNIGSVRVDSAVGPDERAIFSRNGRNVTSQQLQQAVTAVYAAGWYSEVSADIRFADTSADVSISARRNPELRRVMFRENYLIDSAALHSPFDSLVNKPLNLPKLQKAFEHLLSRYRSAGYSLARVRSTSFDSASGTLTVTLNEGKIAKIYFRGKETTRDWVIRRELEFRDGDLFTVDKGKQTLVNLYGTNLFNQVLMDVSFEDAEPVITIHMDEKPTEVSRLGFRLDNERNLQPSVEFRNENLLGTATEAGASFSGGLKNRRYVADFQANRIFNSYLTFNMDLYYDVRDIFTYENDPFRTNRKSFDRSRVGEYRQILYGVLFQLGQQVERLGTVDVEYKLEADEIKFISGRGYQPEKFTLQAIRVSSTIDSRDRYPFARSGSLSHFSWETAISTLKSVVGDVGYSKIYFSYETNTSYERFTLHPRLIIGFGDQTLPLTQQFAMGGEESFYGLREYNTRGRQIFLTSLGLRTKFPFTLIWDTYLRLRYDFGNLWPQREDIRIRDFHHGIGAGLSLDTPAGPVNVSIGKSFYVRRDLLEQPFTLGPTIAYFSLGYPLF